MMRAARFHAAHDVRVEPVQFPTASPSQVLVKPEWCGICGSDLHEFTSGPIVIPTAERPHPLTKDILPVTLGHEFCGRVQAAPPGSRFRPGQAVVADPRLFCHQCPHCQAGRAAYCEKIGFLGISGGGGGGFSELVVVDESMLHLLPDGVSLDFAALAEPLAVAWHATKVIGRQSFRDVDALILGAGPIGYAIAICLRALDARSIYVSQTSAKRRERIEPLVTAVVNPRDGDLVDKCRSWTRGRGISVVFDCVGNQSALEAGIESLAPNGTYVHLSLWDKPMIVPWLPVLLKELSIKGSVAYTGEDFAEVVRMMGEGRLEGYEKMVTARAALDDLVDGGFKELIHNKDHHLKILVTPTSTRKDAPSF